MLKMIPNPTPPPDSTSFFNRFSNEELHQIGLALIQQSQHSIQMQQQIHHPASSQHSPLRLPRIIRPSLETISSIPPLMNHQPNCSEVRPLMEQQTTPVTSTPRRPTSDSFDNSDGNRQRMKKRLRINDLPPRNEQVEQHHLPTLIPPHHHQHSFNMNILKRAVSSNLPCFFIIFSASVEPKYIPSSIQVAIMLKKLFADNQIPIKELSMRVQAGERRFKFAPLLLPDCYALVVRCVPLDINQDTAQQEILKTIPAAVGFSSIHYHHRQRPSYDIRFTVRSLEQYQTALEVGRLSIGQHYLPLTTFLTGYRLTYCTACWKIGHIRDKCQSSVSCRKCLIPYTNGVKHSCQDIFNCAQCGGNHYSLHSICPVVKQYKEELKLAVDKALTSGAIKRSIPEEVSRPFQQHANDFPLLNQAKVNSHSAWTTSGNQFLHSPLKKEMSDLVVTIKALSETMIRTEKSFNDLNNRIEAQHKSTVLHCNSICTIIDTVQIMSSWVQDSVLTQWENNPCPLSNQFIPLNVLTYNVQGWGTRALEVMDLIFKVDSPVCVFTEVRELWNSFKVLHFTSFYQKGTNHSGGVMITIGKHLRATRIDTDIENTIIVDILGLSEQIRIIGIYWPQG
ncbi:unnamed protein product [Rotaria magnacalcarata]|uniref:Uncharacterized protein n=5 Tax=Rotaria magnacalcarata TaxID=392030 RepID=A0A816NG66_9BILA|nr:unnamed protein product [Rotaria magnacalcarata]